ncbi:hypothetical protein CYMTET_4921 [Cymbomonas tetramitiformis]|uniref:Uncharacterized protein n=1 Tax=Cymbomonas tetramitiformis TaxID=36881 RepID=A0AAE0H069_9CHLO|nr:hypothetical protein CYMTET_4921 [Cymbomonas tetramitiformis]
MPPKGKKGAVPAEPEPPENAHKVKFSLVVQATPKPPPPEEDTAKPAEDAEPAAVPPTIKMAMLSSFFGRDTVKTDAKPVGTEVLWEEESTIVITEKFVRDFAQINGRLDVEIKITTTAAEPLPDEEPRQVVCTMSVNCAGFLVGDMEAETSFPGCVVTESEELAALYDSFSVKVSMDAPFFDENALDIKAQLNPLVITFAKAMDMPDCPATIRQLDTLCQPVSLQYQFFHEEQARVHLGQVGKWQKGDYDMPSKRVIKFGQSDIYFAGEKAPEMFRALERKHLDVRIFDRTPLAEKAVKLYVPRPDPVPDVPPDSKGKDKKGKGKKEPEPAAEAVELEPEPEPEPEPVCFGQARFSMYGFSTGQTSVKVRANVAPVTLLKGGAELDWKTRPGRYMEAGASLLLKARSALPCSPIQFVPVDPNAPPPVEATPREDGEEEEVPPPEEPYQRAIFLLQYNDSALFQELAGTLRETNAAALELKGSDLHVLTTLTTYKLDNEQINDPELDLLTGFHLVDGKIRLIVLEGLAAGIMQTVQRIATDALASDVQGKRRILFNNNLCYRERLYGSLGADLWPIKLCQPLPHLTRDASHMTGSRLRPECLESLKLLSKLVEVQWQREVDRMQLLPSAEMLNALDKRFAGELTLSDLEGKPEPEPDTDEPTSYHDSEQAQERTTSSQRGAAPTSLRVRMTLKLPLDMNNMEYLKIVKAQRAIRHGRSHNDEYKTGLRDLYANQGSFKKADLVSWNPHKTWSPPSTEVLEFERTQRRLQAEAMGGATGIHEKVFRWPFPKDPQQYNTHKMKPTETRIIDLQEPWEENPNFMSTFGTEDKKAKKLNLTFPHGRDLEKNPEFFQSVHLTGDGLEAEEEQARENFMQEWRSKLVVDDVLFHTVLSNEQRQKPGQLDRHHSMLHDAPKKKGYSGRSTLVPEPVSQYLQERWTEFPVSKDFHPEPRSLRQHNLHMTMPKDSVGAHIRPLSQERFLGNMTSPTKAAADFDRFTQPLPSVLLKRQHLPTKLPVPRDMPPKPTSHLPLPLQEPPKRRGRAAPPSGVTF